MKGYIRLFLTLIVFIMFFSDMLFAYDHLRYVDADNGDDANTGTSETDAWANLFHAISEINSDSTILTDESTILYVAPGTYPADANVVPQTSYIAITRSHLTIMGASSSDTILDGTNADIAYWNDGIIVESGVSDLVISSLTIKDFSGSMSAGIRLLSGDGVYINSCEISGVYYGIYIDTSSAENSPTLYENTIAADYFGIYIETALYDAAPEIKGNSIAGSGGSSIGIYCCTGTSGSISPLITGNLIYNNLTGIYATVGNAAISSAEISSNHIYDNETGIYIQAGGATTSAAEITNNIIYKDSGAITNGVELYGGTTTGSILSAKLYHNTIDGGTGNGIYCNTESGTLNVDIRYSIISGFTGSSSYGIFNDSSAANMEVDYLDLWNNDDGCYGCPAGYDTDPDIISEDPLYYADYSIPADSPCVDKIPLSAYDTNPVTGDIIMTSRPRPSSATASEMSDIGAYEYPYKSFEFLMPGGSRLATDYRLLTFPVQGSSDSLTTLLTEAFGEYDKKKWRVFAWNGSDYTELGEDAFDGLLWNNEEMSNQGKAFWVTSLDTAFTTGPHTFEGTLIRNMDPAYLPLNNGWNLFALPWPTASENPPIEIGNIYISDGTDKYSLTDSGNDICDPVVWEYTGEGEFNGYQQLTSDTDLIKNGKGYWINVNSTTEAELSIPPDNTVNLSGTKKKDSGSAPPAAPVCYKSPPAPPAGKNAESSVLSAEGGNGCFIKSLNP